MDLMSWIAFVLGIVMLVILGGFSIFVVVRLFTTDMDE